VTAEEEMKLTLLSFPVKIKRIFSESLINFNVRYAHNFLSP
jgi:hypothetical protein